MATAIAVAIKIYHFNKTNSIFSIWSTLNMDGRIELDCHFSASGRILELGLTPIDYSFSLMTPVPMYRPPL
jgi:hypothetical protein